MEVGMGIILLGIILGCMGTQRKNEERIAELERDAAKRAHHGR